jgi:murein DD-endopeptidase MepM/ murein hydrolase activator NlpD
MQFPGSFALALAILAVPPPALASDGPSDSTLRLETAGLSGFFDEILLGFQVLRLSARDPDTALILPVRTTRVIRIANTWHAARSGGRSHEGQDLFAPRGTPVHSATDGYVTRIGENRLGGKTVWVTGAGRRVYYYAHLHAYRETLRRGERVTPRTVLGYVGNTGNARGARPHLHFGVYTVQGAINPLPLLLDPPAEPPKLREDSTAPLKMKPPPADTGRGGGQKGAGADTSEILVAEEGIFPKSEAEPEGAAYISGP